MDNFLRLPQDKRETVINAALKIFGKEEYRKASMNDIAVKAGVSKAILFHYFGDKKALYLYLFDFCFENIMNEVENKYDKDETDFFKKIESITEIKLSAIKKYPSALMFLKNFYYEKNTGFENEKRERLPDMDSMVLDYNFHTADTSKFKDGVQIDLIFKMIIWLAEGYINQLPDKDVIDIDETFREFKNCLALLKKNFYKEDV